MSHLDRPCSLRAGASCAKILIMYKIP